MRNREKMGVQEVVEIMMANALFWRHMLTGLPRSAKPFGTRSRTYLSRVLKFKGSSFELLGSTLCLRDAFVSYQAMLKLCLHTGACL